MAASDEKLYPGEEAHHHAVRQLADEYRSAATTLGGLTRRGAPMSRAPYRLVAIQAIELYLNAFLLARGHDAPRIRRLQHDLAARAKLAVGSGLVLRMRTLEHIAALCDRREYLAARYDPDGAAGGSMCNRLAATLQEVARKTREFDEPR